jgi:hypothetical protein
LTNINCEPQREKVPSLAFWLIEDAPDLLWALHPGADQFLLGVVGT